MPVARRRMCFFLDQELEVGLQRLKARTGIPQAEAIRRAIAEFLKNQEQDSETKAGRKRAATRLRP